LQINPIMVQYTQHFAFNYCSTSLGIYMRIAIELLVECCDFF
jgi:hypothetical protein